MKRKQYSTTTANWPTQKILGRRAERQSHYGRHFRAIETLWRILFQSEQHRVQR